MAFLVSLSGEELRLRRFFSPPLRMPTSAVAGTMKGERNYWSSLTTMEKVALLLGIPAGGAILYILYRRYRESQGGCALENWCGGDHTISSLLGALAAVSEL